jgi:hypothetical protein
VDGEAAIAEILNIRVLEGIEVTQVVAIQKIDLSALVGRENQVSNGAFLIRQNQWCSPDTEILVRLRQPELVKGRETSLQETTQMTSCST